MKSAISSHFDRFGIFPKITFFTLRVNPTGTTLMEKWRTSIRFVTALYENKTHLLIVDRLTVGKFIVGNIF